MTYMIVFESGETRTISGDTLEQALHEVSTCEQYDIVGAIRL